MLALALALVSQGVVQNFDAPQTVATLETQRYQQPQLGADGQALQDAQGQPLMQDLTSAD